MTSLKKLPTIPPKGFTKEKCKIELAAYRKKLFELQNIFYADGRFALLIILQGMDASGKDGCIRHAMSGMDPMGVEVKSFKKPTEEEMQHDFLWRIYPHFPAKGMISVFNRSYYEDVLMPFLSGTLSKEALQHRCQFINHLEEHFERSHIHVMKFYLHLSKEEQEKRIIERLTKPHKRWKYAKEDEKAAKRWDDYIDAYDRLIAKCNKCEWNIVPADKRWYRNYAVAKILMEYLKALPLKYPES